MNQRLFVMSFNAMLTAILLLMGLIPSLGFITINPAVSFTIMHIPVLVGAFLFGWRGGLYYGFLFGFLSFWQASANPTGILDPFFQNPLISMTPRLIFGLLTGVGFTLIQTLLKTVWIQRSVLAMFAAIFTVMHTLLVLGIMGLLQGQNVLEALAGIGFNETYWTFILLVLSLNGIWEALIAFFLLPTLAFASSKIPSVRRIINARR
jgi:uncharacterized membrane protein